MIFVIEKLMADHQSRVEAWEVARKKWCDENTYYSRRDYEENHPRPGTHLKMAAKIVGTILLIAVLATLIIGGAVADNKHDKTHKSHNTAQVQKKPVSFKVGDNVQVVYGDYEDSVGVIVKVTDSDAIIKLTKSTLTKEMCNASSNCSNGGGHDNGELLSISSLKNLVPYKETK